MRQQQTGSQILLWTLFVLRQPIVRHWEEDKIRICFKNRHIFFLSSAAVLSLAVNTLVKSVLIQLLQQIKAHCTYSYMTFLYFSTSLLWTSSLWRQEKSTQIFFSHNTPARLLLIPLLILQHRLSSLSDIFLPQSLKTQETHATIWFDSAVVHWKEKRTRAKQNKTEK